MQWPRKRSRTVCHWRPYSDIDQNTLKLRDKKMNENEKNKISRLEDKLNKLESDNEKFKYKINDLEEKINN